MIKLALGLLWALIAGLGPACIAAADNFANYTDAIDWRHLSRIAAGGSILGAIGWWRKQQGEIQAIIDSELGDNSVNDPNSGA